MPIEKVWSALTTPERLAAWLTTAEVDLRLGGAFRLIFDNPPYSTDGTIVQLDPPRLIAWTWPDPKHPDSVVTWRLTPDGDGCRLEFSQDHLPGPTLRDVAAGWHTFLEGLPAGAAGAAAPWRPEREREIRALYAGMPRA